MAQPVPRDYATTPERYRLGAHLTKTYATHNLYARVAGKLTDVGTVLDIGCADGVLRAALPGPFLVGLDAAMPLLRDHPAPAVCAEATRLPFPDNTFDAVTALNMLYHLADPTVAIREAHRVLRPGGRFIASTIARTDAPELAAYRTRPPTTFDAEEAPAIMLSVFRELEVDAWDGPFVRLPTVEALGDYLRAARLSETVVRKALRELPTPLSLTKRGALLIARK